MTSKTAILLAVVASMSAAGGSSTGEPGPADTTQSRLEMFLDLEGYHGVPLIRIASGHQLVEAMINGTAGTFVVDTGASATMVDPPAVGRFWLGASEESKGTVSGLGVSDAGLCTAPIFSFDLHGVEVGLDTVLILDLGHVTAALSEVAGQDVHGIIGQDVLEACEAIIDCKSHRLYLKRRP